MVKIDTHPNSIMERKLRMIFGNVFYWRWRKILKIIYKYFGEFIYIEEDTGRNLHYFECYRIWDNVMIYSIWQKSWIIKFVYDSRIEFWLVVDENNRYFIDNTASS